MNGLKKDMYDIIDKMQDIGVDAAVQLGVVRKHKNNLYEISGNNKSVDVIKEELDAIAKQLEMFVEYTASKQEELRTYASQVGDDDE